MSLTARHPAELEMVSSRHAESLEIDKTLQRKIKALRSHQDISSKQEIKMLQKQIEGEKEKRHALEIERTSIKKSLQELKDSGLNRSCINGCRPRSSSQASTPVPMADNPAPHLDTEKSPDSPPNHDVNVLNELEVPSMFCFFGSQYLKFNFFFRRLSRLKCKCCSIFQPESSTCSWKWTFGKYWYGFQWCVLRDSGTYKDWF